MGGQKYPHIENLVREHAIPDGLLSIPVHDVSLQYFVSDLKSYSGNKPDEPFRVVDDNARK